MDFLKELTNDNFVLLLLYVAPGFISIKIWNFLHPGQKISLADSLIEAIIYSIWNTIVVSGLIPSFTINIWMKYGIYFVVFPVLWPVFVHLTLKIRFLRTLRNRITPTSWDYFFNQGLPCFIILYMKNGNMIGGLYGGHSFTSSYPEREDIYLEEVWRVDSDGKFLNKIENTAGMLVHFDDADHMEFFAIDGEIMQEGANNDQE